MTVIGCHQPSDEIRVEEPIAIFDLGCSSGVYQTQPMLGQSLYKCREEFLSTKWREFIYFTPFFQIESTGLQLKRFAPIKKTMGDLKSVITVIRSVYHAVEVKLTLTSAKLDM